MYKLYQYLYVVQNITFTILNKTGNYVALANATGCALALYYFCTRQINWDQELWTGNQIVVLLKSLRIS